MQLAEMQNLLASLLGRISRTQIPITRFPLISPTERSFPNFNRYSNFLSISRTGFCSAWRFEFYIRLLLCYCLLGCITWSSLLSLWMKSQSVTIERKAIQQHFLVVLFIMLYKVLLTLESVWTKSPSVTVQMKATEQLSTVLFITLYEIFPTFESVDEILKCEHWNESYWAVLPHGTISML